MPAAGAGGDAAGGGAVGVELLCAGGRGGGRSGVWVICRGCMCSKVCLKGCV